MTHDLTRETLAMLEEFESFLRHTTSSPLGLAKAKRLAHAAECVRNWHSLRDSINDTECVAGCDSVAHAEGCTTTDLALHLVNTQREVAALRDRVGEMTRIGQELTEECNTLHAKRAAEQAELATLRAKAEIVDAMERELRKVGDGVLIGFAREYSDYSEYEGKHYHWPETFYFGDEMQDGAPYASLGEAFTAYAQARAAQERTDA